MHLVLSAGALPNLAPMVQDLQPYALFLLSALFPPPFWVYLSPSPPAAPLSSLSLSIGVVSAGTEQGNPGSLLPSASPVASAVIFISRCVCR